MIDYDKTLEAMKDVLRETKEAKPLKVVYRELDIGGVIFVPKEYTERFAKEIALFLKYQITNKGLQFIPIEPIKMEDCENDNR